MKKIFTEIKERKIRKWLTIYISTAITTIGVTHLLSIRYSWPDYIFDIVFFTLLFGIFGTALLAWFHGKEGRQKLKITEIVLQSILFIVLITTLFVFVDFEKRVDRVNNSKVVAVLPFTNFNETSDTEFFADGITDDVLTQLSKISDLKVISRTSVMKYKNTDLNISEISNELGAGTILEGSVRKYGNKIRITGQLIDANNDIHIWSETYDRELEDVFDIQSDIAERIAAALNTKLSSLEKKLIENKSTEDTEAYQFYFRGKESYYKFTHEENEKAIEFFKKALSLDSNYALALAGLSDAYGQRVSKYLYSKEWTDSSMILSRKALEINPYLPEAYKSIGSVYQSNDEFELALLNYQKAIELNPSFWSAILNYGQIKTILGHHDEALYWLGRAQDLSPLDIMGNLSLSMVYRSLNCDSSAIFWCKEALQYEPDHLFANSYLADLYVNIGDFKSANSYFKKSVDLDSNWVFGWFMGGNMELTKNNFAKAKEYYDNYIKITNATPEYFYAFVLSKLGELDSAKVIYDREINDYSTFFSEYSYSQVFNYIALAEIYASVGNQEKAFEWWEKGIEKGFTDKKRIELYPFFDDMRMERKYSELMAKMVTKIDSFQVEAEIKYPKYFECM